MALLKWSKDFRKDSLLQEAPEPQLPPNLQAQSLQDLLSNGKESEFWKKGVLPFVDAKRHRSVVDMQREFRAKNFHEASFHDGWQAALEYVMNLPETLLKELSRQAKSD